MPSIGAQSRVGNDSKSSAFYTTRRWGVIGRRARDFSDAAKKKIFLSDSK